MVSTLYVVRDSAGVLSRGALSSGSERQFIQLGRGQEVSLNLARQSVTSYARHGHDLALELVDGRQIILGDFFASPQAPNQLYLSQNGELVVVQLQANANGGYSVMYGGVSGWEKYSSIDALRFADADPLLGYAAEETATGFAPVVGLGGLGWGLAGLGALAAIGGGGGGGDDDTRGPVVLPPTNTPPAVNAPHITLNQGVVSVHHVETAAHYANGVQIGGTGTVGGLVTVTIKGHSQTTTVGSTGVWQVTFDHSQLLGGHDITQVIATISDAQGRTTIAQDYLQIDTIVDPLTYYLVEPNLYANGRYLDGIINNSEANAGVSISGTVEAGATSVLVWFANSNAISATITGTTWTAIIPSSAIPTGLSPHQTATATVTIRATDRYGNVSPDQQMLVKIDRTVEPLTLSPVAVLQDDILNAADLLTQVSPNDTRRGLPMCGTVEPNALVEVTLRDSSDTVVARESVQASADGRWTVVFASSDFPPHHSSYQLSASLRATDSVGNTRDISNILSFTVDTKGPDPLIVLKVTTINDTKAVTDLYVNTVLDHNVKVYGVDASGHTSVYGITRNDDFPTTMADNSQRLTDHIALSSSTAPDGSYLVIKNTDTAGNESSTLFVSTTQGQQAIDLSRFSQGLFDFAAIDLTGAHHAQLTLRDADLIRLTGGDNELLIRGDGTDTVKLYGATQLSGQSGSRTIHNINYDVYSMNGGQLVLIEDDITVQHFA